MYPKLDPRPVQLFLCSGKASIKISREKIAAAYAGACAAKERILRENTPLFPLEIPFKELYNDVMPTCIEAANNVGLSAVPETLEYWNPGKHINEMLRERIEEHFDNPWYPFFEDD